MGIASNHLSFFCWHPVGTEVLSCYVHLEIAFQLSLGRLGTNSCAICSASWAVTLISKVLPWTILIKHSLKLSISRLQNHKTPINTQEKKNQKKKPQNHNTLETGFTAHENEAPEALRSLRHREKFQSTALPTHTPHPETNPTQCVNSWKKEAWPHSFRFKNKLFFISFFNEVHSFPCCEIFKRNT